VRDGHLGDAAGVGHANISSTLFPFVAAGGSKVDQALDSTDAAAGRRPLRAFLTCPNPDEAIVGVFGAIDTVKIRKLGAWCVKISPHPPEPGGTGVLGRGAPAERMGREGQNGVELQGG
jgi:hypothetical protein